MGIFGGGGEEMNAEETMQKFQQEGYEVRLQEREAGVKNKVKRKSLWIKVNKEKIREAVEFLMEISEEYPHFSIISASDEGNEIILNYHFTLGYGKLLEEFAVTFQVALPKNDLNIKSITNLVPAAIFSEREIREMVGVEFEELADKRHLFLTKDFPDGVYPWRRDETGVKETNKLYETWKEGAK